MKIDATNNQLQEVELCLLSGILIDGSILSEIEAQGYGREIMQGHHSAIVLAAMYEIDQRGDAIDLQSIAAELQANGHFPFIGYEWLAELPSKVETTAHARTHLRACIDALKLAQFKDRLRKLNDFAEASRWHDVKDKVEAVANELIDTSSGEEPRSQKQVVDDVEAEARRLADGKDLLGSRPIYTGIPSVDKELRPLDVATGDFNCLLFAPTSCGKSSLAAMIIANSIRRGLRVAVFLGETSSDQLVWQMASQASKVSADIDEFKEEPRDRQERLIGEIVRQKEAYGSHLYVYDDAFFLETIIGRCRHLEKSTGSLDLIVIDHLHCLKTKRTFRDVREKFNYISGELKPLAKTMRCTVLSLAQPSRESKKTMAFPNLSDLKETGNLEDDADRVWAIWIPEKTEDGQEQSRFTLCPEAWIVQLKFRKGKVGRSKVTFVKPYTLFEGQEGAFL